MFSLLSCQAANPGCLLEDFVRWYSPNDWLQGEETEDEIEYRRKLEIENERRKKGEVSWRTRPVFISCYCSDV